MTGRPDRVIDTSLIDSLHEPIFVVGPDDNLLYANERLSDVTNRPPEEFENSPVTELTAFVETGFADLREGIDALLRENTTERRVDVSMTLPDDAPVDTRIPVEARLTRLTDGDGLIGVLVVMRDITDQKKTEQHLRASERRFRAMFEAHSAPMLLIEPQSGNIEEANVAAADFYGYSIGELTTMSIQEINCHSPSEVAAKRRRARNQNRNHFEFEHELASSEVRTVEVHSSPIEVDGRNLLFSIIHDITERKRREREYEQIFNNVNDAIIAFDPEAEEITQVNDAYKRMFGYTFERIRELGIGGLSVVEEGYTENRGWELIREVAETGESETTEWRAETNDGDRIWLEVTLTSAEIGGEQRVLSIQRDVTERKRRQREYEQIFDGVNDGVTIHDPGTGEILDANETYLEIFGYDDVETVREIGLGGLSATEEGYTEERARALINDVAESEEPRTVEWQIETADGEQRWFESTVAPAEIAGEERVLAIQRDVTERKRREREFEQIFNGVRDAISVHDPSTVRILDVNDAYLDMFGYETTEEVRERGVSGLSITDEGYTEQRGREIHQRVVERGQPESLEWQSEVRSGERIWLGIKVAPAVIGGKQRTIAVHRDITERKRREQRLAVFNRILRHNLRNQLDVIRSYAEELVNYTRDDHAEQIIDATDELAEIGRSAQEIDRVISKTEAPTEIDIAESLRKTVETMDPSRSDVTVTTEFPDEACLRTHEESVTMAVESALENAIENATSAVTVAIKKSEHQCLISIRDDGPGIPDEVLTPLQVGKETPLQHGRGLGLWQLRWCVDTLNGDLSFETEDGTTVRITVPDQSASTQPD
jgi:PAS domain S-box-containing protein